MDVIYGCAFVLGYIRLHKTVNNVKKKILFKYYSVQKNTSIITRSLVQVFILLLFILLEAMSNLVKM